MIYRDEAILNFSSDSYFNLDQGIADYFIFSCTLINWFFFHGLIDMNHLENSLLI